VNAGKPAHHGVHDVREPVAALQCVTAMARGPRYRCQLASCFTVYRGQVVRVARHLRRLRQPASDLLSLFNIHVLILSI
jgi:branched-subunit amino acid aminotransferase/4-amino-4-deoxychorismate lyase